MAQQRVEIWQANYRIKSSIAKLLSCTVLRFGDAVRSKQNALSGLKGALRRCVSGTGDESNNQVAFFKAADFRFAHNNRGNVAAVYILDQTTREEFEQNHGGILADISYAQKLVYQGGNLSQALAGEQLGVNDALQRSRYD